MRLLLIPLFLIFEIALSISVANLIGAWPTVIWLILAVVLGINLLRIQGPASMMRATEDMRRGGQPGQALVDGLFNSFAAILLIVPGFLSDLLALLILIVPLRRLLLQRFMARIVTQAQFQQGFGRSNPFRHGNVYEHQGDTSPVEKPADAPRIDDDRASCTPPKP